MAQLHNTANFSTFWLFNVQMLSQHHCQTSQFWQSFLLFCSVFVRIRKAPLNLNIRYKGSLFVVPNFKEVSNFSFLNRWGGYSSNFTWNMTRFLVHTCLFLTRWILYNTKRLTNNKQQYGENTPKDWISACTVTKSKKKTLLPNTKWCCRTEKRTVLSPEICRRQNTSFHPTRGKVGEYSSHF